MGKFCAPVLPCSSDHAVRDCPVHSHSQALERDHAMISGPQLHLLSTLSRDAHEKFRERKLENEQNCGEKEG